MITKCLEKPDLDLATVWMSPAPAAQQESLDCIISSQMYPYRSPCSPGCGEHQSEIKGAWCSPRYGEHSVYIVEALVKTKQMIAGML
jgi:hypothetical protein